MFIPIVLKLALFVLFLNVNTAMPFGFKKPLQTVAKMVFSPQKLASSEATGSHPVGTRVVSSRTFSLEKRYENRFVNNVFKDNILLNLAYMEGAVNNNKPINWNEVKKPLHFEFTLKPNEVFAYHEDVLPQYQGKVVKTTNAHFNAQEQFLSDGYLVGDGVCHLASLLFWVAKDANLDALAPTNHNFAPIPEVPKEYGVSIYNYPGSVSANAIQNLYIANNKTEPVTFHFNYDGKNLEISISKENKKLAFLF